MPKAGEVDFKKNAMERDAAALPDKEQTYQPDPWHMALVAVSIVR